MSEKWSWADVYTPPKARKSLTKKPKTNGNPIPHLVDKYTQAIMIDLALDESKYARLRRWIQILVEYQFNLNKEKNDEIQESNKHREST